MLFRYRLRRYVLLRPTSFGQFHHIPPPSFSVLLRPAPVIAAGFRPLANSGSLCDAGTQIAEPGACSLILRYKNVSINVGERLMSLTTWRLMRVVHHAERGDHVTRLFGAFGAMKRDALVHSGRLDQGGEFLQSFSHNIA